MKWPWFMPKTPAQRRALLAWIAGPTLLLFLAGLLTIVLYLGEDLKALEGKISAAHEQVGIIEGQIIDGQKEMKQLNDSIALLKHQRDSLRAATDAVADLDKSGALSRIKQAAEDTKQGTGLERLANVERDRDFLLAEQQSSSQSLFYLLWNITGNPGSTYRSMAANAYDRYTRAYLAMPKDRRDAANAAYPPVSTADASAK